MLATAETKASAYTMINAISVNGLTYLYEPMNNLLNSDYKWRNYLLLSEFRQKMIFFFLEKKNSSKFVKNDF